MSKVKFKRLPDGYGRILSHKGRRLRNPYSARKRIGTTPDGKPIYKTIGQFPTYAEAFAALVKYHDIELPPDSGVLFEDLYHRFREEYLILPKNGKVLSVSALDGYRYAYNAVSCLHKRPFLDITAPELQDALENAGGSASKQQKIKVLYSKMYQFADFLGLTDRNLADFVRITEKDEPERNPFKPEEIAAIWQMPRSRWRDAALVMLYTGMRVSELLTVTDIGPEFFRAGLKTEAGYDRIIPIHPEIAGIFRELFPFTGKKRLAERWFERNLPGHRPHDCRRTFVTFADECGINPTAARQIVGHSTGDVHVAKYTLHPPEYLLGEIKKLKYF